jgi:GTP diphosphokinase / guanosine-3',5'-bis(diphosphate) 3'-diphosphatase
MMNPTMVASRNLESLLLALPQFSPTDRSLVERAYAFAEAAHEGQTRKSGEPYITHPLEVAYILAEMHMDAETLAAALLHDVVEDVRSITINDLQREFGDVVATIVDGVTKLEKVPINTEIDPRRRTADRDVEYIVKMLMGMGDDVRVVLVKLADRLHNMRTLHYMKPEKQTRIAHETLDIFAPLANRLGIWQIKWELEDLAFRYIDPEAYREIADNLSERRSDRDGYLQNVIAVLRRELEKAGLRNVALSGRPKHIYSIYKKMGRKNVDLDKVYDVRAVRVIVDDKVQCYTVLGIVHSIWRPIPGEFDDYIAAPKDNFYQSLHTAVYDNDGKTLEVQIRTREMHEHAEYGIAAHWRYKEGKDGARDEAYERRIEYIRRLMEDVRKSEDASDFMENMKNDVFKDRVYAVTPKGDVVDMAAGATPIDFAYHIHTDLGHRCRGAKVNGHNVSLNHVLKTGDQVDIIATKQGGPSLDWLNPDLGYVNTPRARQKVKYWFRKQHRDRNIAAGRDMLEREMKKLGVLSSMQLEQVASFFDYDRVDDLLAMIGAGEITGRDIANHVLEHEKPKLTTVTQEVEAFKVKPAPLVVDASHGVSIQGMGGMLVSLAKCCHPVPGDAVVGFITRGRGVAVHRQGCPNMVNLAESERSRLIDVDWGSAQQELVYPVPLEVVAYDREGLLRDITTLISDDKINISHVSVETAQGIATIHLTLQIGDMSQLSRILTRIERIRSVVEVRRSLS